MPRIPIGAPESAEAVLLPQEPEGPAKHQFPDSFIRFLRAPSLNRRSRWRDLESPETSRAELLGWPGAGLNFRRCPLSAVFPLRRSSAGTRTVFAVPHQVKTRNVG